MPSVGISPLPVDYAKEKVFNFKRKQTSRVLPWNTGETIEITYHNRNQLHYMICDIGAHEPSEELIKVNDRKSTIDRISQEFDDFEKQSFNKLFTASDLTSNIQSIKLNMAEIAKMKDQKESMQLSSASGKELKEMFRKNERQKSADLQLVCKRMRSSPLILLSHVTNDEELNAAIARVKKGIDALSAAAGQTAL